VPGRHFKTSNFLLVRVTGLRNGAQDTRTLELALWFRRHGILMYVYGGMEYSCTFAEAWNTHVCCGGMKYSCYVCHLMYKPLRTFPTAELVLAQQRAMNRTTPFPPLRTDIAQRAHSPGSTMNSLYPWQTKPGHDERPRATKTPIIDENFHN